MFNFQNDGYYVKYSTINLVIRNIIRIFELIKKQIKVIMAKNTPPQTNSGPKIIGQQVKNQLQMNLAPKLETKDDEVAFIKYDNPKIIEQIEKEYPEMTDEFKRIMFTQYELFCLKQSNYGPNNISVGTKLETDEDKKLSLTGLWFRINDKIQRLKQLIVLSKEDSVGESIEDTFQDLSVYGIIAQIVSNGKWAK
jgi:uncharacterized protein YjaZ